MAKFLFIVILCVLIVWYITMQIVAAIKEKEDRPNKEAKDYMEGKEKVSTSLKNVEETIKSSIEEKEQIQQSLKNINQQTNESKQNHNPGN